MSSYSFKVVLTPLEVLNHLKKNMPYELVHERVYPLDDDMCNVVLIFEKYYIRTSSRAALTVIVHNYYGATVVEALSAGSSQGMIFSFDWGAGDDFASSVKTFIMRT